jgi:hypothetical protein
MSLKFTRKRDSLSPASTFGGDKVTRIKDEKGNEGRGRGHTREDADKRATKDLQSKQDRRR